MIFNPLTLQSQPFLEKNGTKGALILLQISVIINLFATSTLIAGLIVANQKFDRP